VDRKGLGTADINDTAVWATGDKATVDIAVWRQVT
jgi:hypothetical protein